MSKLESGALPQKEPSPPTMKPCFRCRRLVVIGNFGMLLRPEDGRPHDCNETWMAEHGYSPRDSRTLLEQVAGDETP